jgi:hypothetical protein
MDDDRRGFRHDPEFATGWIILGVIVLVLVAAFGLVTWASGSWVLGLVVAALVGVGLTFVM